MFLQHLIECFLEGESYKQRLHYNQLTKSTNNKHIKEFVHI